MYKSLFKRGLDILMSLLLLLPIILICVPFAVAIKIEDHGPVMYNGERLGKNMRKFKMFKLRTMDHNAPDVRNSDGSTFNSYNDTRVTKVGKFLRKSSIDELPQILNVLIGDMSFVGPRPSPLGNESRYTDEFKIKFSVRPGITGLNQALLRNTATMEERTKNDVYYVMNLSPILDLKIVVMTFFSVLKQKNIARND